MPDESAFQRDFDAALVAFGGMLRLFADHGQHNGAGRQLLGYVRRRRNRIHFGRRDAAAGKEDREPRDFSGPSSAAFAAARRFASEGSASHASKVASAAPLFSARSSLR